MNKITRIFKNNKALITYLTAGDPFLSKTEEYIVAMANSGADLIEIGIPFSDPVAEGEIIQNAMLRALSNNMSLDNIFNMIVSLRKKTDISLVFMTYLNPILNYGYENFFKKCKEVGVNGLISPDMPFEEHSEVKYFADKYNVTIITFISPTSKNRIKPLAIYSNGFIYLISSLGVTGIRNKITMNLDRIVFEIKKVTNTPVAVGFGISTVEQVENIIKYADGVIIGSAIVRKIAEYKYNAAIKLEEYVTKIKRTIESASK
jgi:tryptophan synthase alpha chain